jgi:hypothetical protein
LDCVCSKSNIFKRDGLSFYVLQNDAKKELERTIICTNILVPLQKLGARRIILEAVYIFHIFTYNFQQSHFNLLQMLQEVRLKTSIDVWESAGAASLRGTVRIVYKCCDFIWRARSAAAAGAAREQINERRLANDLIVTAAHGLRTACDPAPFSTYQLPNRRNPNW